MHRLALDPSMNVASVARSLAADASAALSRAVFIQRAAHQQFVMRGADAARCFASACPLPLHNSTIGACMA